MAVNTILDEGHEAIQNRAKRDLYLSLSDTEAKDRAHLFKALADPIRLQILDIISKGDGSICVDGITEYFTITQPTISHHLRTLHEAGLVGRNKQKGYCYYFVIRRRMLQLERILMETNFASRIG